MKNLLIILILPFHLLSQPYLKQNGKTRHRFAQSVFGIDLQTSYGGQSSYINETGGLQEFDFKSGLAPRFYISGVHFWGHAEFFFSFQMGSLSKLMHNTTSYNFKQTDIFGTKIYPWPIQKKKVRPFIGATVSAVSYHQSSPGLKGPVVSRIKIPLIAGINYCTGRYLLEAGINYNFDPSLPYYISEKTPTKMQMPSLMAWIGIRKWLETTVASEKNYLDGTTEERYQKYKKAKKLSSWYFGAGPSSAFFTKHSPFNNEFYTFMDKPHSVIFPEVSSGYFYEPWGIHTELAFRYNSKKISGYGVSQQYQRTALTAKAFKYLFDYHGFNPYLGACFGYEWLSFSNSHNGSTNLSINNQTAPGIIAGWDILPDKLQGFVLRTNLRYFPNLSVEPLTGKKIFLDQLEFNFIQLIIYPQRLKNFKSEG